MKRVVLFAIAAGAFEIVALILSANVKVFWLLETLLGLFVLYLLVLSVRGWRRQMSLDVRPVMTGRTVRKRHWTLF